MISNGQELLKLLLPEYLVEFFDIIEFEEKEGLLHLYFEEKSTNAFAEFFYTLYRYFRTM